MKTESELFKARDALLELLRVRGDLRPGASAKGASLLALAAIHASHISVLPEADRVAFLTGAHRNLFNAK